MTRSKRILKALTYTERLEIQNLLDSGSSQRQVSLETGIGRTSIAREIKRCSSTYNAEEAQLHFDEIKQKKNQNLSTFKNDVKSRLQYLEDRVLYLESLIKAQSTI